MFDQSGSPGDNFRCPFCGKKIIKGSKFCVGCGKNIENISQNIRDNDNTKRCLNCGNPLIGNENFCPVCGNNFKAKSQNRLNEKICPNCGYRWNSDSINCPKCGFFLNRLSNSKNSDPFGNISSYNYPSRNNTHQNSDPFVKNHSSKSNYQEYNKKDSFERFYKTNYLLIGFFIVSLIFILVPIINIILIIISSILVYYDTKQIITIREKEKMLSATTWSPFSWFLMTLLFWIIGFPLYLLERKRIWIKHCGDPDFIEENNVVSGIVGFIALIVITTFLAGMIAIFVFGLAGDLDYPGNSDSVIYPSQYATPVQNYQNLNIGRSVQNDYEKVTLKGVTRKNNYFFTVSGYSSTISSDPGKEFIFCDVEIENIGEDSLYLSSASFSLEDPYGYKLEPELYSGNDGLELFKELYPGQKAAGIIAFQVDTNSKGYKLFYKLNGGLFDQPILASWIIN